MKNQKIKSILTIVMILSVLLNLTACGGEEGKKTQEASKEQENSTVVDEAKYDTVPKSVFLELGQEISYTVEGNVNVDATAMDSTIASVNTNQSFSLQAKHKDQVSSSLEDNCYYRIFSKCYNTYISSDIHQSGGLKFVGSASGANTVWKAEKGSNGFYLRSIDGYLSAIDSSNSLTVAENGVQFYLVSSSAEGYNGSFGILTSVGDRVFRLDGFASDQISTYSDDGKQYAHTSFYLYEMTGDDVESTQITFFGNKIGDTNISINGEEYYIHVYNPLSRVVDFTAGTDSISVRGYELTDSDVHDEGFYQYQCNLETSEIVFTQKGEGKAAVTIGAQTYYVYGNGTEATYNGKNYTGFLSALIDAENAVDQKRFKSQIVSIGGDDIMCSDILSAGVLLNPNGHYGMGNEVMLTYTAKSNSADGVARVTIYPTRDGSSQILYLPSVADYSKLNLHLPANTTISSSGYKGTITVTESDSEIDLTQIFGDMSAAGEKYSIHVSWDQDDLHIEQDVTLMKSANIHSIYFEVEEDNVYDMLEWLNTDKTHRTDGGNVLFLSSDGTSIYEGTIKNMHMRGNSSIGSVYKKPSYSFKLSEKASMIDGTVKARSWCLVANGTNIRDNTTYGTAIGDTLYQRMNSDDDGDYAIQFIPTDLYINGEYRGMYMLTDKVNDDRVAITSSKYTVEDEDEFTRVKAKNDPAIAAGIQEYYYAKNSVLEKGGEGGFVIEICGTMSPDTCGFVTRRGVPVEIKEPGCATKKQVQQIATYFQKFEDALYGKDGYNSDGKYYADYIDIYSFGKMYVLKSFLEDMDLLWGSFYMYIDGDASGFTTALKCCTGWDYDACWAVVNGGDGYFFDSAVKDDNSAGGYKWQFMEYDDFQQVIRKINSEKVFENNTMSFTDLVNDMCSFSKFIDNYYEQVNSAMSMNKDLWSDCTWSNSGETTATTVKNNLRARLTDWNTFFTNPDSIGGIPAKQ